MTAIVAVAVAVAECLPRLEVTYPWPGALTAGLLLPLAAIYGCVPETDHLPTIAAVIATVAVMEIVMRRPRRIIWHGFAVSWILWGAVYGAVGRERAVIGGLFAFWPIVLVGAVAVVMPGFVRAPWMLRVAVFGVGSAAALIVSRTGALQTGRRPAAHDAAATGSLSLVAALMVALVATLARRSRRTS